MCGLFFFFDQSQISIVAIVAAILNRRAAPAKSTLTRQGRARRRQSKSPSGQKTAVDSSKKEQGKQLSNDTNLIVYEYQLLKFPH